MVKSSTCRDVFKGHCRHWGLSDAAHALVHAQMRRLNEVYRQDVESGKHGIGEGSESGKHGIGEGSESSVRDDGPALEALLRDEGYVVVATRSDA